MDIHPTSYKPAVASDPVPLLDQEFDTIDTADSDTSLDVPYLSLVVNNDDEDFE